MKENRPLQSEFNVKAGVEDLPNDESTEFVELVDDLMQRMSNGEDIDLETECQQYSDRAFSKRLRQIFPVIRAVSNLSVENSTSSDSSADANPQVFGFAGESGRLGDFRLIGEIGRGGMGIVYEAEQISLDRRVALKILPFAGLLDERQLQRFKNEARAAAMLRHPHIVNVFHVGYERGIHFYAMDLIDGKSLAEVLHSPLVVAPDRVQGAAPTDEPKAETDPIAQLSTQRENQREEYFRSIARLGIQAADALQHAHQQGVVHRDIKPSNLLIDRDGRLHVTDFGLAHVSSGAEITVTGDMVGTLRYMSPEQAEGQRVVDHRTDVFSLGLTLYELATGQPAFTATNRRELLHQVITSVPETPSKHCGTIPRDFETIILKAIEKDPSARYDTADALTQDLNRFLSHRPVTAHRTGKLERTRRWIQRNPIVASLIGFVGVLLLLIAIGSSAFAVRLTAEAKERELSLYAADIRLVQQALHDGRRFEAETLLLKWAPGQARHDHRGFEWYHLWQACHDPALKHTIRHQLPVDSLCFLGDSNRLAIAGWDRSIHICDVDHDFRLWGELASDRHAFKREVQFLSNSSTLLSIEWDGKTVEWDLQKRMRIDSFDLPMRNSASSYFMCVESADGKYRAIGGGNDAAGTLVVIDCTSGQHVFTEMDLPGMPFLVFTEAGELVVLFRGTGQISVFDMESWKLIPKAELPQAAARAIAVTPDRRRMAISTYRPRGIRTETSIRILDLETFQIVDQISLDGIEMDCLEFSQDGRLLAAGANITNWMFVFAQQDEHFHTVAQVQAHDGSVTDVAFAPEDDYLVSAGVDGKVHFWSLPELLQNRQSEVKLHHELRFSLQGGFIDEVMICNGSAVGELVFWNADTGEVKDTLQLDSGDCNAIHVVLSNDRKLAGVVMGHSPDQTKPGKLSVIDLATKKEVYAAELPRGISSGEHYAFSHDRRFFVTSMYHRITVLDLTGETETREFEFPGILKDVDFAPDGDLAVVACANGMIYQLDVPSFQIKRGQRADERLAIRSDYSPDGRRLAVVGFDKRINLFDARTLKPIDIEFSQMSRYPVDVKYSPDGQRILTGSPDGKIHLWHAESGERLLTFNVRDGWYPSVDFSPLGNSLAFFTGPDAYAVHTADSQKLKRLSHDELLEIACQHIEDY